MLLKVIGIILLLPAFGNASIPESFTWEPVDTMSVQDSDMNSAPAEVRVADYIVRGNNCDLAMQLYLQCMANRWAVCAYRCNTYTPSSPPPPRAPRD